MIYDRDLRHEIVKCQKRSKVAHKHLRWRILQRAAKLLTLDVCEKLGYAFTSYIWQKRWGKKRTTFFTGKKERKNCMFL